MGILLFFLFSSKSRNLERNPSFPLVSFVIKRWLLLWLLTHREFPCSLRFPSYTRGPKSCIKSRNNLGYGKEIWPYQSSPVASFLPLGGNFVFQLDHFFRDPFRKLVLSQDFNPNLNYKYFHQNSITPSYISSLYPSNFSWTVNSTFSFVTLRYTPTNIGRCRRTLRYHFSKHLAPCLSRDDNDDDSDEMDKVKELRSHTGSLSVLGP